jgi:hypothetical protein
MTTALVHKNFGWCHSLDFSVAAQSDGPVAETACRKRVDNNWRQRRRCKMAVQMVVIRPTPGQPDLFLEAVLGRRGPGAARSLGHATQAGTSGRSPFGT